MIELCHLTKSFGGKRVVEDLSLTARDGAVTALLGPNGAGKTTSLRLLTGLLAADRGEVRIDGIDVRTEALAARRRLGVMVETPGLYARLSAREHLEYSGALHGLTGARLALAVEGVLARLEMRALGRRIAEGFSQGERRKVALGRALVHDPANVVLDEPTNGLDVGSARAVRRSIRALADAGKCVILSSHVLSEVAATSDRVVILARGRVVADGAPDELLRRTGARDLEEAFLELIGSEEGVV